MTKKCQPQIDASGRFTQLIALAPICWGDPEDRAGGRVRTVVGGGGASWQPDWALRWRFANRNRGAVRGRRILAPCA